MPGGVSHGPPGTYSPLFAEGQRGPVPPGPARRGTYYQQKREK